MKPWLILIYGLLLGLLATGGILLIAQPKQGSAIELLPAPTLTITSAPAPTKTPQPVTAQIAGAVQTPGVFTLSSGARLQNLIDFAGGLAGEADSDRINLALPVRDGDYFYIPSPGEQIPEIAANAPQNLHQSPGFSYPLDLNEASQEALESLPGIGPSKAADILAYRAAHGRFESLDDLLLVPGIGEATLETLREYLIIEP